MGEWVVRLNAVVSAGSEKARDIPGARLLGFFEDMAAQEHDSGVSGSKAFRTEKCRAVSEALRGCGPVRREWMEATFRRWREGGFLRV